MPFWIFRHGFDFLPVASGAYGMGCIGYPAHPAWEVTSACNLRCSHCHAALREDARDDLSTAEALSLIGGLSKTGQFHTLVYTGGEPLTRPDIFELLSYSKKKGFVNILASNAILINGRTARKLKQCGVAVVAVSLDSARETTHNFIRNDNRAFSGALAGIESLKEAGIPLQINTTVMEYNFEELDAVISMASGLSAGVLLMYQLVAVGRGAGIKDAALDRAKNLRLLEFLKAKQRDTGMIIEPVAAPQYWSYLLNTKAISGGPLLRMAGRFFHGCCAGRGFVYIKSNGDVWPCPFLGVSAGNVKQKPFPEIWGNAGIFKVLRERENHLKGKCAHCSYSRVCGGCRGRAWAATGDFLAEDPACYL